MLSHSPCPERDERDERDEGREELDHYMDLIRRIMAGEELSMSERVALDRIGPVTISTVKLTVPIGDERYESAIEWKGHHGFRPVQRYKSPQDAIEGHQGLVAHIRLHVEVLPAFQRNQERRQAYQHRAGKTWSARQGPKKRRK